MLLKIFLLYHTVYILLPFLKILWHFYVDNHAIREAFQFFLSSLCAFPLLALSHWLQFLVECGNFLVVQWLDCT